MAERAALSKRLRFEIFKRDGFRCFYCGATPQDLPLHVDHVKPVAAGGTDEPHNLITACRDCNGGKSDIPLEQRRYRTEAVTEADKERAEQLREYLRIQREVYEAKTQASDDLMQMWSEKCGTEGSHRLRTILTNAASEFGYAKVAEAIDIVAAKELRYPDAQQRYVCGIFRNWREEPTREESLPAARPPAPTQEDAPPQGKPEHPFFQRIRLAVARAMERADAEWQALEPKPSDEAEVSAFRRRHMWQILRAFLASAWERPEEIRYWRERFRTSPAWIPTDFSLHGGGCALVLLENGRLAPHVVRYRAEFNIYEAAFLRLQQAIGDDAKDAWLKENNALLDPGNQVRAIRAEVERIDAWILRYEEDDPSSRDG